MWLDFYGGFGALLATACIWWLLFFGILRLKRWGMETRSWKADLVVTAIQSVLVTMLFPVIVDWLR